MTITTLALVNGAFALLMLVALRFVFSLGLRVHRVSNEQSVVPAQPTPRALHVERREELARAA